MSRTGTCKHPEQHHLHLCALRERLDRAKLATYIGSPRYVCANCGGRTREGKHLCWPVKIRS